MSSPEPDPWLSRERVLVFSLMVVTAIVLYLCWRITQPFVPSLTWALALTVISHPLHERLARIIHNTPIAAALTVLIVTVVVVAPMVLVARQIAAEAARNVNTLDGGEIVERWNEAADNSPRMGALMRWLDREGDLEKQLGRLSESLLGGTGDFLSASLYIVAAWLVTLYVLFYFLRDKSWLLGAVRQVLPLWTRETTQVFDRVRNTIYAIVYGTLVVSLVQGTLGGLMFWWLDIPSPLIWGAVMALLSVLPAFGAAIIWVPVAAFYAFDGDWNRALVLAAWGTIVMGLVDNVLYPVLVKDRLRLHTVPVFIAILGGLIVFGGAGLVLGPVVLAVANALFDIWRQRLARAEAAEATPARPVPRQAPRSRRRG